MSETEHSPESDRPRGISPLMPMLLAAAVAVGILIGAVLSSNGGNPFSSEEDSAAERVSQILRLIEKEYVDTINSSDLAEKTIKTILGELDPHSYYISAEEFSSYADQLEGNFDGIGIEFMIRRDTVVVINPVEGGPSEAAGIMPGDRIIAVNDTNIAGPIENRDQLVSRMKGPSGTKVNLTVLSPGRKQPRKLQVTRGKIPLYSVEAAFMANDQTAYVKVSNFSKTTYDEFVAASASLRASGMKRMILDLRGNGGGIFSAATQMADEFLEDGKPIVYTEGKSRKRDHTNATSKGSLENVELVILINENSASASEIVAGAIQDNDRGTIIGRRSFGKGLVQEQRKLEDGSAIRLTVARYYTPTGRCIQKPYGDGIDYYAAFEQRMERGELLHLDSISLPDSLRFVTPGGKVVYGGGGILPDVFVPLDTTGYSGFLRGLTITSAFNEFAFDYVDNHRSEIGKTYMDYDGFRRNFEIDETIMNDFLEYAYEAKSLAPDSNELPTSKALIEERLKALIARNIWRENGYYPIVLESDTAFQQALRLP